MFKSSEFGVVSHVSGGFRWGWYTWEFAQEALFGTFCTS